MVRVVNFKQLIRNPLLDSYTYIPVKSDFIKNCLNTEICLPTELVNRSLPFVFSCFVLSVDGKICYPDTKSGLDLAKCNYSATTDESYADWLCLMMARTISNAIILSGSSIKDASKKQILNLPEEILRQDQIANGYESYPLLIIFSRDLAHIDFSHPLLQRQDYRWLICLDGGLSTPPPLSWNWHKLSNLLTNKTKLQGNHNIITMDESLSALFTWLKHSGVKVILNESPLFHHKLLAKQLLNEMWLNYSGVYIGGDGATLGQNQAGFMANLHPESEMLALYHLGYHFLYSRQLVKY